MRKESTGAKKKFFLLMQLSKKRDKSIHQDFDCFNSKIQIAHKKKKIYALFALVENPILLNQS